MTNNVTVHGSYIGYISALVVNENEMLQNEKIKC